MKDLRKHLARIRKRRRLTMAQAAEQLGVQRNTVWRWEKLQMEIHPLRVPIVRAWLEGGE